VAVGLLFLFGNYNLLDSAVIINKAWPALLVASGAYLAFCGIKEGMENTKAEENKRTKIEETKRRRNKRRTNNI